MRLVRFVFCNAVTWLLTMSGTAFGETLTDYFPLVDGNYWVGRSSGPGYTSIETKTVLGTEVFNGRSTKEIRYSGGLDGVEYDYWTNDSQGIRVHGDYYPSEGRFFLEPPLTLARTTMDVGESVESSGRARFIFFGVGTASLNYEAQTVFEGYETLTVPAGTYETIKLKISLRIFGTIGDEEIDETSTVTDWYAKNIGDIQSESVADKEKTVLLRTNVRQARSLSPILDLLLD